MFSCFAQAQNKDSISIAGIELQKAANCRFNSITSAAIGITVLSFSQTKETVIFSAFAMVSAGVFQFCAIWHEKKAGKLLEASK